MKRSCLYIFFLFLCAFTSVYSQGIPSSIRSELAQRETRYHHFLWHNIRNLWNQMDSETQNAIRRWGWAPPRPSQRFTGNTAVALENNLSGEDFLFMHRQMFRRVGVIPGWSTIPGPDDGQFPVPPAYTGTNSQMTNSIRQLKTSSFYRDSIAPRERRFKDPNYLRTVTLGQLGSQIEFTIHNWIHIRWSARSSLGLRNRVNSDPVPDVDDRWNNPAYDWLIDPYGSHLNPYFYRIHGWVDARVEDWRRANGLGSINWRGRWTGGPMSNLDQLIEDAQAVREGRSLRGSSSDNYDDGGMDMNHDNGENGKKTPMGVMEEVAKILFKTGLEANFYDKVMLEEDLPKHERLGKKKRLVRKIVKCKSKKQKA